MWMLIVLHYIDECPAFIRMYFRTIAVYVFLYLYCFWVCSSYTSTHITRLVWIWRITRKNKVLLIKGYMPCSSVEQWQSGSTGIWYCIQQPDLEIFLNHFLEKNNKVDDIHQPFMLRFMFNEPWMRTCSVSFSKKCLCKLLSEKFLYKCVCMSNFKLD